MSRTVIDLMADLAVAADAAAALRLVNTELAREKSAAFVLLGFDVRRQLILGPGVEKATDGPAGAQIAVDHLPVAVRQVVIAGARFADVGEQSGQYAQLLGIPGASEDCQLYMRGLVVDGALSGVLVAKDQRRRSATKVLDKIEPMAALVSVAFARFYERDARFEAVNALHEVTTQLRAAHDGVVGELEREITRLREARGDVIDRKRAEQLVAAAESAKRRAATAENRLMMVEQQVSSAVERLERAHLQLHQQTETLHGQAETISRLESQLAQPGVASSAPTPPLAGVASRAPSTTPVTPTRI